MQSKLIERAVLAEWWPSGRSSSLFICLSGDAPHTHAISGALAFLTNRPYLPQSLSLKGHLFRLFNAQGPCLHLIQGLRGHY
jgi:hypothetical protein